MMLKKQALQYGFLPFAMPVFSGADVEAAADFFNINQNIPAYFHLYKLQSTF